MSDNNVVEFTRLFDPVTRDTIFCTECQSRAMRLVTGLGGDHWEVECHNCGNLLDGIKVVWEISGTQ